MFTNCLGAGVKLKVFAPSLKVSLGFRRIKIDEGHN
jgi:hypothetical protein